MSEISVLWLIPARSGSKSVPNKNIKYLNELPLLAYRIKSALSIKNDSSEVWVSTDSLKYKEISEGYGAEVPFLRPKELASDESSSMDVVAHALEWGAVNGFKFDFIGLMEPTSPFIYSNDVKRALHELASDHKADSIVAVRECRPNSFFIQRDSRYLTELASRLKLISNSNRQAFETEITPSGGFYISRVKSFKKHKTFYTDSTLAYRISEECSLEIDEPFDWDLAEFLIAKRKIDVNRIF